MMRLHPILALKEKLAARMPAVWCRLSSALGARYSVRQRLPPTCPWSEAGGDSLDLLRLWFRIEKTLSKSLSMEAMHQNVKPSEIIETIERMLDVSSEKSRTKKVAER